MAVLGAGGSVNASQEGAAPWECGPSGRRGWGFCSEAQRVEVERGGEGQRVTEAEFIFSGEALKVFVYESNKS